MFEYIKNYTLSRKARPPEGYLLLSDASVKVAIIKLFYVLYKLEVGLPIFLKSHVGLLFHLPRYALLILTSISASY